MTVLSAVGLTTTGCQQQQQGTTAHKKTGTYAAARHSMTGSNIPQPYSANSVDSTMDTDALSRMQTQQMNLGGGVSGATGGGR